MAKEILWTIGYSTAANPEPKDARKFLEDIYGDVEVCTVQYIPHSTTSHHTTPQLTDDVLTATHYLEDDSLLYPEDVWPEAFKGGARYGKYQRGLGPH